MVNVKEISDHGKQKAHKLFRGGGVGQFWTVCKVKSKGTLCVIFNVCMHKQIQHDTKC